MTPADSPAETSADSPAEIPADTKDWTWVLDRPCPDCGYDATSIEPSSIAARTRDLAGRWPDVLARANVRTRPTPEVWSPLEYGCHTRDVFAVFDRRLALMLAGEDGSDAVRFDNWDQDQTARRSAYSAQDPAVVSTDLLAGADAIAARFDSVDEDGWTRTALRSDGARFTTVTFGRYFLHDVVHHLHDVKAADPDVTKS